LKNKKRIAAVIACLGAACVLAGCGLNTPSRTDSSIGVVDEQLILSANPNMPSAQTAMNEEYAKVQNELKDTAALSAEEKQEKIKQLRKQLSDKESTQLTPIRSAADDAVKKVMQKHGMDAVVNKKAMVAGGTDITKEVLMEEGLSEKDADAAMQKANSNPMR